MSMKLYLQLSLIWCSVLTIHVHADVRVLVQQTNGLAYITYQCTGSEVVRCFGLDITVDQGQIVAVTNFFRGQSTSTNRGYGVFPASFRDNIAVSSGTNANWSTNTYTPLAVAADNPGGTQPGLGSPGVTLEFGALWDPSNPAAAPASSGTLCALQISQPANVTVSANASRGGIIGSPPDVPITTHFTGALVGPAITQTQFTNGVFTILFQSGELQTAPTVSGPWTGTGNYSGSYSESVSGSPAKFFRVYNH